MSEMQEDRYSETRANCHRPFSHKPPTNCSWARGETKAHLEAKQIVFDGLQTRGVTAMLEYVVDTLPGDRRADVMAWSTMVDDKCARNRVTTYIHWYSRNRSSRQRLFAGGDRADLVAISRKRHRLSFGAKLGRDALHRAVLTSTI